MWTEAAQETDQDFGIPEDAPLVLDNTPVKENRMDTKDAVAIKDRLEAASGKKVNEVHQEDMDPWNDGNGTLRYQLSVSGIDLGEWGREKITASAGVIVRKDGTLFPSLTLINPHFNDDLECHVVSVPGTEEMRKLRNVINAIIGEG